MKQFTFCNTYIDKRFLYKPIYLQNFFNYLVSIALCLIFEIDFYSVNNLNLIAKIYFFAFSAIVLTNTIHADDIPNIGSPSGQYLSPYEENRWGDSIVRELRKRVALVTDPEINDYISSLGNRLTNTISTRTKYRFFVISSNEINAFAAPGGVIAINTGLIKNAGTEAELASVIAHEIGHVEQKHIARRIASQEKSSLPQMAALIAGILVATQNPEAGSAIINGSTAAGIQNQLSFSRDNEREADRVGINILSKAGFDPDAMVSFFEILQNKSRIMGQPIEYLSTHPLTSDRIADAKNLGRSLKKETSYKFINDNIRFQLSKNKIIANEIKNSNQAAALFNSGKNDFSSKYGLAVSYNKIGKYKEAEKIFKYLIRSDAERVPYINGLSDSFLGQEKLSASITVLKDGLKIFPDDLALKFSYAIKLFRCNDPQTAHKLLKDLPSEQRKKPFLLKLLAKTAAESKKMVTAEGYMAEYYFESGHYNTAIDHYSRILKNLKPSDKDSGIKKAAIEARLLEIKNYLKKRS